MNFFLSLLLFSLTAFGACAAEAFGYTQPYRQMKMSFPETGVIAEIRVEEGEAVKKGDILARLDYQVLQKDLEIARQELELQTDKVAKLQILAKGDHVSPEELKRAVADQTEDNLKVQKAEAEIEGRTLRSPVDGVVTEVKKEISESVDPSTHVLTVVQLDRLLVNIYLPPAQAAKFHAGMSVPLYWSDGGGSVPAQVEFVSPVDDAASNTVRVKFVIPNADGSHSSGIRCQTAPPIPVKPAGKEPTYQ